MITDEYRELNAELHRDRQDYGKLGTRWAVPVFQMCAVEETTDVLDYGCGKGELNLNLPFQIHQYDPAIEKWSDPPEPADVVVCTDVMEHVEPEFTDAVLDDLKRLTKKKMILNIALTPAVKTLSDGRNAHLVVQPAEWWKEKVEKRFDILHEEVEGDGANYEAVTFYVSPKNSDLHRV